MAQGHPTAASAITGLRRRAWLGGAVALGAGPLWGCSAPVPLLRVGSVVFPTYEFAFAAREAGWLDAAPLRLVEFPASTYAIRALVARQIEAAQLTLDEAITACAAGTPLTVALVLDTSVGADAVIARPGIGLSQLAGARVGLESGAVGAVMLDALLSAAGLKVGDVRLVGITQAGSVDAYHSGKVDVVVTAEPWSARLVAAGGVRLFDSSRIPNRIVDVLAVRSDLPSAQRPALRLLVASILKAQAWHRSQAAPALAAVNRRMRLAPSDLAQAFNGLALPSLDDNRRLLAPGGEIEALSSSLVGWMRERALLRPGQPGRPEPRLSTTRDHLPTAAA